MTLMTVLPYKVKIPFFLLIMDNCIFMLVEQLNIKHFRLYNSLRHKLIVVTVLICDQFINYEEY